MFLTKMKQACLASCGIILAFESYALGVSSDPGDYKALPVGTNLAVGYYQYLEADKVYNNGNQITDNLDLSMHIGMLRYVRFVEVAGITMNPQIVLPMATQKIDQEDRVTGLGDILIGGVAWPYQNKEKGQYLAFGGFLSIPTGSDAVKGLSVSNDRYQYNLQGGYLHQVTPKFSVEGIAQAEFYSNKKYNDLKKDMFYQTDLSAIYYIDEKTNIAATWRYTDGGKEKIEDVTLTESENKHMFILSAAKSLKPNLQLMLQWRQDVKVEDGSKISGLQSRLVYAF